jgi:two-component system KDP operon response regulator KdpE
LVRVLVAQRGRTMTHRQLFMAVWNREYGDASLHLRVHLTHLRRKIEQNPAAPRYLVTDPGVGYRFELPDGV